ncbi:MULTISPECIES: amino acid adenylation domain-containing protein [unclassified Microcoleus]|uniref:amino acid adenylation domain-containing protein n=1 Tax=unclassified Microcoleus TaxID=2642155 RepID=UPI002FD39007
MHVSTDRELNAKEFSCFLIGETSLLIQCGEIILKRKHQIVGIVSPDRAISQWAKQNGIPYLDPQEDWRAFLSQYSFDYLFSIANALRLPPEILALPRQLAINYHDAPLPKYAGINATSWALMNREKTYAVTWHQMSARFDEGDILKQFSVDIADKDTVFTLDTKCYEAAGNSFIELVNDLSEQTVKPIKQNLEERTYFSRSQTPIAGYILSWNRCALDIDAFVRALDFGPYRNPLGTPKFAIESDLFIVSKLEVLDSLSEFPPGTIAAIEPSFMKVCTASYDVALHQVLTIEAQNLSIAELVAKFGLHEGYQFKDIAPELAKDIETFDRLISKYETFWVDRLTTLQPITVPYAKSTPLHKPTSYVDVNVTLPPNAIAFVQEYHPEWNLGDFVLAAIVAYLARIGGTDCFDIGFRSINLSHQLNGIDNFFASYIPCRIDINLEHNFEQVFATVLQQVELTKRRQSYTRDVAVRYPDLKKALSGQSQQLFPAIVEQVKNLDLCEKQPSSSLRLAIPEDGKQCGWSYDPEIFDRSSIETMLHQFETFVQSIVTNLEGIAVNLQQPISKLSLLTETERHQLLVEWNNTGAEYPLDQCIHQLFEAQVERTPDAVAVVFEGEQLTYRELNARANQLAHHLRSVGVGPEVLVGICVERSLEMVVGLLGILKAGGAYVPLDSAYPPERVGYMLEHAQAKVLLTQVRLVNSLPQHQAQVFYLDADWGAISTLSDSNPTCNCKPENLAYIIYTSGSTGKPKGVAIEHRGVANTLLDLNHRFGVEVSDRILAISSLSFDLSVYDIFGLLAAGGTIIIPKPSLTPDPAHWQTLVAREQITLWNSAPALMQLLADYAIAKGDALPSSLRLVMMSGDWIPMNLPTQIKTLFPIAKVISLGGATEASIWSILYPIETIDPNWKSIPYGQPMTNQHFYVLDQALNPCPVGISGHLYIGGIGLARGYWRDEEKTRASFIAHPLTGERLYRTGDLGRYMPDRNIEFLGRIDNQVKIRGFRIELGEIETVLSQHPDVRETLVIATDVVAGNKQLVAYIVPQLQAAARSSDLRSFLKQKLADYMIPGAFLVLDALPLTPNGKVDRRALLATELHLELEETFVAPRTPIEEMLASIWSNILSIDFVGIRDNFFELGGNSLLATQVISRMRDTLAVELPLRSLFEAPTIAELAERVENSLKNKQSIQTLPLVPIPRSESIPLSFAQARLWFLDRLEPNSPFYNIPLALRLSGQLNIAALENSINEIIRRHEALRTNFATLESQPVQVIASTLNCQLQVVNLLHLESHREIEAQHLANEEANRPFNLEREPLLRGMVLQLGETEYVLLLTMHHIISDGWSLGLFVRELAEIYKAFSTGQALVLPELPVQYADFSVWQRRWLTGQVLETQLDYWKQQLKDIPTVLELPTDRPRKGVQSFRGAHQSFAISQELSEALVAYSKRTEVTLFMTLLTAFQTLLYRYTGQDDIAVGTPFANRNRQEIEGLIGFFVNTLVLRTDLGGNPSFEQLLNRVREVALQAYAHQDVPFDQLVEALQPKRDVSYTPLFQVVFALDDASVPSVELPELTVSSYSVEIGTAKFDLTLSMENTADGLVGVWEYNTDLFDETTIARMARHFQTLLEAIATNPKQPISELPLLTETERHQLLVEWNHTWTEYPQNKCIHQLFEEQVEREPDAIALVFEHKQLTYKELNQRANQLAHHLRNLGVGAEVMVGIGVERSLEMVVGILGILKAGGAYVPLDPAYPPERLTFMLEDTSVSVLLTQAELVESLPKHQARVVCLDRDWEVIERQIQENPSIQGQSDNLAYVMYTSGSTGIPKGVSVIHQGVVRLVKDTNYANLSAEEVFLQLAPISFDASTLEIWGSLLNGARLVIMPPHTPSLQELGQAIRGYQITTLWLTAGLFHIMVDEQLEDLKQVRQLLAGGDVLSVPHVQKVLQELKGCQLINGYGPTENTTFTCCYRITEANLIENSIPIGGPIANTQVYILDAQKQPVPIGIPGELYIGGAGLARGYLNRPDLTADRFILNPFSHEQGDRLYKTGDLARYLSDGNIEFLGRIDQQVKIRGFRIELGEIEAVLSQHPDVRESVVIKRDDASGNQRLVAYIVSNLRPERTPFNSECLAEFDGNPAVKLRTEDISIGGVGILGVPDNCGPGQTVRLRLRMPGSGEERWLEGTVAWCRRNQAGIELALGAIEQDLFQKSIEYLLETQGFWKVLQRTAVGSLRNVLKQKLPNYMMPSNFVFLNALPLTPNGKIDRKALPEGDTFNLQLDCVAPQTENEDAIATDWEQVLHPEKVGVDDNLLDIELGDIEAILSQHPDVRESVVMKREDASGNQRLVAYIVSNLTPERTAFKSECLAEFDGHPAVELRTEDISIGGVGLVDVPDTCEAGQTVRLRLRMPGFGEERWLAGKVAWCRGNQAGVELALGAIEQDLFQQSIAYLLETQGFWKVLQRTAVRSLRNVLKQKLPNYMMPSSFVFLNALPLIANGKVDPLALPVPDALNIELETTYVAPQTDIEQAIATVWQQVLHLEKVGVDDNFFDLGGHSLLMAQAHSKLKEAIDRDVSMMEMFKYPTISSLAKYLSEEPEEKSSVGQSRDRINKQKDAINRQKQKQRLQGKNKNG